jgi:hypothetical protein
MMSKTKYILFGVLGLGLAGGALVICAALVIGIGYLSAQADEKKSVDLKSGDKTAVAVDKLYQQTDVDGLIKFHEWAADTKFTAEQRRKFEAFLAKDFERDAAKARKDTDETLEAQAQIKDAKKDVREMTRTLLAGALVEDFKKKKADEYARFMLGIYEKTNDDEATVSNNNAEKISFTGGGIPDAMVGSWTRSEGSSQIDSTGKTQYGGGAHFTYDFSADGSVKYRMDKKLLTIMQCKIEERKSAEGTAAVSGDVLNIDLGETAFFSSNSCDDAKNFDKTLPAETVSLKWRLKTEYDVTRLCIDEKDGEMCYDRKD